MTFTGHWPPRNVYSLIKCGQAVRARAGEVQQKLLPKGGGSNRGGAHWPRNNAHLPGNILTRLLCTSNYRSAHQVIRFIQRRRTLRTFWKRLYFLKPRF